MTKPPTGGTTLKAILVTAGLLACGLWFGMAVGSGDALPNPHPKPPPTTTQPPTTPPPTTPPPSERCEPSDPPGGKDGNPGNDDCVPDPAPPPVITTTETTTTPIPIVPPPVLNCPAGMQKLSQTEDAAKRTVLTCAQKVIQIKRVKGKLVVKKIKITRYIEFCPKKRNGKKLAG